MDVQEVAMRFRSKWMMSSLPVVLAACGSQGTTVQGTGAEAVGHASAALGSSDPGLHAVAANPKSPGVAPATVVSVELSLALAAQGSQLLENPATVTLADGTSATIDHYGYMGPGPMIPAFGTNVEAQKTEPDKNTYLVLNDQTGPDAKYDYGTHFLFQGHEVGIQGQSYITRVNLDADAAHHITLWATSTSDGKPLNGIDGSTWDPFAKRLVFTTENSSAGTYQSTLSFPPVVEDISGAVGRGGYEGIQNDAAGNLWIVEDVTGAAGTVNSHAKQPNSFIYRFVPKHVGSLKAGKLQALQVISLRTGTPIAFHAGQADADILSADTGDLRTYGKVFDTTWVTIHDTDLNGTTPFDANAAAKAAQATPLKRPENGQFRPGVDDVEFFFDETGDTNLLSEAGSAFGGFGDVFKYTQRSASSNEGKLSLLFQGDAAHAGFDNVAFWNRDFVAFVEDAGDTLHTQRNALDSGYLLDVRANYADPKNVPLRFLAQGRDPSATIDSALGGTAGFNNEGDNEITGIHVSNGDADKDGILGARVPQLFHDGWRAFFTEQHGDNRTWEIIRRPGSNDGDHDGQNGQ
jgi:hypothetical protein